MPTSDDFLSGDKTVAGIAAEQIYPGVDAPVLQLDEWWIRVGQIVDKDSVLGPLARGEVPAAWEHLSGASGYFGSDVGEGAGEVRRRTVFQMCAAQYDGHEGKARARSACTAAYLGLASAAQRKMYAWDPAQRSVNTVYIPV